MKVRENIEGISIAVFQKILISFLLTIITNAKQTPSTREIMLKLGKIS